MMRVSAKTIRDAYERHFDVYARGLGWNVEHHIELWATAKKAFDNNSFKDFEYIYEDLRGYWQVFRSSGKYKPPTARELFGLLNKLDSDFGGMKLSNLRAHHMAPLWKLLSKMVHIKRNKDGPSVMAVSKFLHFWNPRLFVIVDKARMADYAFKHRWLGDQIEAVADEIDIIMPESVRQDSDYENYDFGYYPAIIYWCSQIIRDNPNICPLFYKYLCDKHPSPQPPRYLEHYEAAAVEWLLCGLVEIPPNGVQL